MIKHIVLFKFKEFSSTEEKTTKLNEIKSGLLNLKGLVSELQSIEVGINENPKEQFDIALTTTHLSMDDLQAYAVHPAHVAAAGIIATAKESRACVDYEI